MKMIKKGTKAQSLPSNVVIGVQKPDLEGFHRGAQSLKKIITSFFSYFVPLYLLPLRVFPPTLCLCAFCLCAFIFSSCNINHEEAKDSDRKPADKGIYYQNKENSFNSAINTDNTSHNNTYKGMTLIPRGEFIMGSDKTPSNEQITHSGIPWFSDEHPQKKIFTDDFFIDSYETTNAQYWRVNRRYPYNMGQDNYPLTDISWFEADSYCKMTGKFLPSETEWEKAARGLDGRQFPWGNRFETYSEGLDITKINNLFPVGTIITDRSPYQVYDMAGSVSEWTDSWYEGYEGSDYKNEKLGEKYKVIRGGSWSKLKNNPDYYFRAAYRQPSDPRLGFHDTGVRCVSRGKIKDYNPYQGMIKIPGGKFIMGSNKKDTDSKEKQRGIGTRRPLYIDEYPEREAALPSYYIDKFEVTNAEYQDFNPARPFPKNKENHPVTGINWYDAEQFCRFTGKRLPTEAEWEKAARGEDGRQYPWGNEFDEKKLNSYENKDTTAVGSYENGKSPYGVYDMSGNVWEWTIDWYQAYQGNDFKSDDFGEKFKVARGGGFGGGHYNLSTFLRTSHRLALPLDFLGNDTGFRCAKD